MILNSEKSKDPLYHNDLNMIQLGGQVKSSNAWYEGDQWLGFEKGWGQKRYERFDPAAVVGDLTTWSDDRALTKGTDEEVAEGGLRNPYGETDSKYIDSWGGWWQCVITTIPKEMHDWNQADADYFTAEMAARQRIFTRE